MRAPPAGAGAKRRAPSTVATEAANSASSHGVLRSVPLPSPWTVAAVQTARLR